MLEDFVFMKHEIEQNELLKSVLTNKYWINISASERLWLYTFDPLHTGHWYPKRLHSWLSTIDTMQLW